VRSFEVVSDPTNVLALEAAVRRRAGADVVHLAACHRVLRNQRFDGPGGRPHSELFALVSSARDSGSARTEAELLVVHLRFWSEVLSVLLGPNSGLLDLTVINDATLRDRVDDTVRPALHGVQLRDAPDRTQGIGYYRSAAFKIGVAETAGAREVGDGGFTGCDSGVACRRQGTLPDLLCRNGETNSANRAGRACLAATNIGSATSHGSDASYAARALLR
jgi:hypothetical protein